jgi:hypothetical protein
MHDGCQAHLERMHSALGAESYPYAQWTPIGKARRKGSTRVLFHRAPRTEENTTAAHIPPCRDKMVPQSGINRSTAPQRTFHDAATRIPQHRNTHSTARQHAPRNTATRIRQRRNAPSATPKHAFDSDATRLPLRQNAQPKRQTGIRKNSQTFTRGPAASRPAHAARQSHGHPLEQGNLGWQLQAGKRQARSANDVPGVHSPAAPRAKAPEDSRGPAGYSTAWKRLEDWRGSGSCPALEKRLEDSKDTASCPALWKRRKLEAPPAVQP